MIITSKNTILGQTSNTQNTKNELPRSGKLEGSEIGLKPEPAIESGNHIGLDLEFESPSLVRTRIEEKGYRRRR